MYKRQEYACVESILVGPSLFAFSMEDPGSAARLFKGFAKENDNFEIKALAVSGQLLHKEQIDVLAKLPTRDQALGMLANIMLAPITKFVRTLNEVPTKTVRVLAAIKTHKESEI